MPVPIHVAAVQYATETHNRSANYHKALHLMDDAAHSADLILMPQFSFQRFWPGMSLSEIAEPIPGPYTAVVSQVALTRNAYICYSAVEREDDRFYSTAVLVGGDGHLIGKHRKTHLSEMDLEAGLCSGGKLDIYNTHIGAIAMALDSEAMDVRILQLLHARGADLILVPCTAAAVPPEMVQSTVEHWTSLLTAGAKISHTHIVWANKIGEERGFPLIGSSMIASPNGDLIARGSIDQEEFVRTEITPGEERSRAA